MNAFAHKDDKSNINLGNESDLTGIGDGTAFGAIKAINNDLTDLKNKGLKTPLSGTISITTGEVTVDVSSLGLSSADDYLVTLTGDSYITEKTATYFKVWRTGGAYITVSYQVTIFA